MPPDEPVLDIRGLVTRFRTLDGELTAVAGVDLTLYRGQVSALVGESGCGKSVTALSALRLLAEPPARVSGEVRLRRKDGRVVDIARLDPRGRAIAAIRGGEIAMIFQEPMRALSPVYSVGHQVAESARIHRRLDRRAADREAVRLLERVGIPDPAGRARSYPHELSGGQRQRVMIAMALASQPAVLFADEPTTALDVTIQAQIIDLIRELQADYDLAVLLITHDLGVVAGIAHRVNVMYMGRIVERADVRDLFARPAHPYTRGLLAGLPRPGDPSKARLTAIPGSVPDPFRLPPGCPFGPRCDRFEPDTCDRPGEVQPVDVGAGHDARCYRTEGDGGG